MQELINESRKLIEYAGENRIYVDELLSEDNDSNPQIELTPDNLCFLIYTCTIF